MTSYISGAVGVITQSLYERYGIAPERVADVVAYALDLPPDTTVNEFTIGPANQPW